MGYFFASNKLYSEIDKTEIEKVFQVHMEEVLPKKVSARPMARVIKRPPQSMWAT